jgi:hypothetical protein
MSPPCAARPYQSHLQAHGHTEGNAEELETLHYLLLPEAQLQLQGDKRLHDGPHGIIQRGDTGPLGAPGIHGEALCVPNLGDTQLKLHADSEQPLPAGQASASYWGTHS